MVNQDEIKKILNSIESEINSTISHSNNQVDVINNMIKCLEYIALIEDLIKKD